MFQNVYIHINGFMPTETIPSESYLLPFIRIIIIMSLSRRKKTSNTIQYLRSFINITDLI